MKTILTRYSKTIRTIAVLSALALIVFGFQNCSGTGLSSAGSNSVVDEFISPTTPPRVVPRTDTPIVNCSVDTGNPVCAKAAMDCTFNGRIIPNGGEVNPAFAESSVPFGVTCISERRLCNNGILTGGFVYSVCNVGGQAACIFNGVTILHNNSITAYNSQGQNVQRTCVSGQLGGNTSYNLSAPPATDNGQAICIFNGVRILHNNSVTAYNSQGQSLQRKCVSGLLGGDTSYNLSTPPTASTVCKGGDSIFASPDGSNSCSLQWPQLSVGQTVPDISGTNGGKLVGVSCTYAGWNFSGVCPNKQGVTCPAGSSNISSPNGQVICRISWGMASPGQEGNFYEKTNGGTASGLCTDIHGWDFRYACPDAPNVPICVGGGLHIASVSGKPEGCYMTWPHGSANTQVNGSGTNGGTMSYYCNAKAEHVEVKSNCP